MTKASLPEEIDRLEAAVEALRATVARLESKSAGG